MGEEREILVQAFLSRERRDVAELRYSVRVGEPAPLAPPSPLLSPTPEANKKERDVNSNLLLPTACLGGPRSGSLSCSDLPRRNLPPGKS